MEEEAEAEAEEKEEAEAEEDSEVLTAQCLNMTDTQRGSVSLAINKSCGVERFGGHNAQTQAL